jgi:hypothetical protein
MFKEIFIDYFVEDDVLILMLRGFFPARLYREKLDKN